MLSAGPGCDSIPCSYLLRLSALLRLRVSLCVVAYCVDVRGGYGPYGGVPGCFLSETADPGMKPPNGVVMRAGVGAMGCDVSDPR